MSSIRTLSFIHQGDYISYNGKIYKVDWSLKDGNNVINIKDNQLSYIDEYEKVKWLRNFENITLLKGDKNEKSCN